MLNITAIIKLCWFFFPIAATSFCSYYLRPATLMLYQLLLLVAQWFSMLVETATPSAQTQVTTATHNQ